MISLHQYFQSMYMKTTQNLLNNQNYTFSEKQYEKRLKEIQYARNKSKPSKIKNLILWILILFVTPYGFILLTTWYSIVLTIYFWLLMTILILIFNMYYEKSNKRVLTKKFFKPIIEKLEKQMWEHDWYIIHWKHNGWNLF